MCCQLALLLPNAPQIQLMLHKFSAIFFPESQYEGGTAARWFCTFTPQLEPTRPAWGFPWVVWTIFLCLRGFPPLCSGFFSQSKDVQARLIGNLELLVCVNVFVCLSVCACPEIDWPPVLELARKWMDGWLVFLTLQVLALSWMSEWKIGVIVTCICSCCDQFILWHQVHKLAHR